MIFIHQLMVFEGFLLIKLEIHRVKVVNWVGWIPWVNFGLKYGEYFSIWRSWKRIQKNIWQIYWSKPLPLDGKCHHTLNASQSTIEETTIVLIFWNKSVKQLWQGGCWQKQGQRKKVQRKCEVENKHLQDLFDRKRFYPQAVMSGFQLSEDRKEIVLL